MTHLLFAGHNYYPKGGIDDLVSSGTVDELKDYFQKNSKKIASASGYINNWGQIVNPETMLCVLWGSLYFIGHDAMQIPGVAVWRDKAP